MSKEEEAVSIFTFHRRSKRFTNRLQKLQVHGWFGRNIEGEYRDDESVIKYLHIPPSPQVDFDLTLRHEQDEERTSGLTSHHMFKWIMDHSKDDKGNPKRPSEKIIAYRCYLQTLLMTPYEYIGGWNLYAVKLRGSIYFDIEDLSTETIIKETSEKLKEENNKTDDESRNEVIDIMTDESSEKVTEVDEDKAEEAIMTALKDAQHYDNCEAMARYGGKFEQYLSSKSPTVPPDPTEPLRKYDDFCCVMSANLGHLSLLYSGEMDAMPFPVDLNNLNKTEFVELKTVKENCNPRSHKRYRLLKWWAQCVLAKCEWILLGHRDDELGVVRRLERIRVSTIPQYVHGIWDSNECYAFLLDFLRYIDYTLSTVPEGVEFKFVFDGTKTSDRRKFDIETFQVPPEKSGVYLPDFYVDWLLSFPKTS